MRKIKPKGGCGRPHRTPPGSATVLLLKELTKEISILIQWILIILLAVS